MCLASASHTTCPATPTGQTWKCSWPPTTRSILTYSAQLEDGVSARNIVGNLKTYVFETYAILKEYMSCGSYYDIVAFDGKEYTSYRVDGSAIPELFCPPPSPPPQPPSPSPPPPPSPPPQALVTLSITVTRPTIEPSICDTLKVFPFVFIASEPFETARASSQARDRQRRMAPFRPHARPPQFLKTTFRPFNAGPGHYDCTAPERRRPREVHRLAGHVLPG